MISSKQVVSMTTTMTTTINNGDDDQHDTASDLSPEPLELWEGHNNGKPQAQPPRIKIDQQYNLATHHQLLR